MRGLDVDNAERRRGRMPVVQGEVALATAPELEAALERALPAERGSVIVDLRAVTVLDSSARALLLRRERTARAAGRRLIVLNGPPQVQKAFDLTGMSARLITVDKPPDR